MERSGTKLGCKYRCLSTHTSLSLRRPSLNKYSINWLNILTHTNTSNAWFMYIESVWRKFVSEFTHFWCYRLVYATPPTNHPPGRCQVKINHVLKQQHTTGFSTSFPSSTVNDFIMFQITTKDRFKIWTMGVLRKNPLINTCITLWLRLTTHKHLILRQYI